ncbi:hypothetical protein MMC21_006628 [Puttea exsequens]|nr:hypothetical protein [Puttea exsequens]
MTDMSARVEQAMNDAIAMAQFAAQRAVVPQTQGSLFASFFGGVEDAGTRGFVSARLNVVGSWAQQAGTADNSVTIYCGDQHLTLQGHGQGVTTYIDQAHNEQVALRTNTANLAARPCSGINGLTWEGNEALRQANAGNIIMICNDPLISPFPALRTTPPVWTLRGKQTDLAAKAARNEGYGIDTFRILTSKTLLHESMPASDYQNFPAAIHAGPPPVPEQYGYTLCHGLAVDEAIHNADTFDLLSIAYNLKGLSWHHNAAANRLDPQLCPTDVNGGLLCA